MIQVQNGRFHFNWIGKGTSDGYPRYSAVMDEFKRYLNLFITFLRERNFGELKADQWEITYINQIPKDTVWKSPSDWSFFKLLGSAPAETRFINEESFSGDWRFAIRDRLGRLHAQWKHGITSTPDNTKEIEVVWLTLTARGSINSETEQSTTKIMDGLDLGHNIVVCAFRDFMSDDANRYWGLK
jgi:uncharacterized protein (TIGR04255 family)